MENTALKTLHKEIQMRIQNRGELKCDDDVQELIENHVLHSELAEAMSVKAKIKMIDTLFYKIRRDLNILQPYADDQGVCEIMVNGKDMIFVERNGRLERVEAAFDTIEELEEVIRRMAAGVHKEINELNPILDARLPDGSRIHAVYKNIALNGPILTIRRFPENRIQMNDLLKMGTLTQEAAIFLKRLVECGYNVFISGGTSSGKTTFLNVLTHFIPRTERIVVIEDSAELQIDSIDNIVRLECHNANVQGKGAVTMQQLIKASLRMRPNRIIVGEVRGEEVMDMIQAMNTGHDGSLSTGHGNSTYGMLRRLEAMFLQAADFPIAAIRSQIAEAVDIIVHLGKLSDASRKVLEVSEVQGIESGEIVLNKLFEYKVDVGLVRTKNSLKNTQKLEMRGVTF